jgi:acyl carrier protein
VEELLANIWSEVLGVPQVGIHDNFFELGGHSLLATQVIARISKTFRAELPLRRLFEQPTIAVLAASIEQSYEKQKGRVAPRIPTARRKARSLEQLLTEVTQFSDTEVESLLQAKSSSSSQSAVHKKAVG